MSAVASQITDISIVYLTVYSGGDQRKSHSSVSLASVSIIHQWLEKVSIRWRDHGWCYILALHKYRNASMIKSLIAS